MAVGKIMRGGTALALGAAIALLVSGCVGSGAARATLPDQVDAPLAANVDEALTVALERAVALSASSGGVAGVWAPWAGEWQLATGTTTIGGSRPMTVDTHFRIGEITRGMTCTVLLGLVDDGVVTLDDTAAELLPDVPGTAGVTLGQLCQSTSGLADSRTNLAAQFAANPERPWPALELVANALALPRTGAPGSVYSPSDAGYLLLAVALEAASHRSWADLYNAYVIGPLGLAETSLPSADQVTVPGVHAAGYLAPRAADGVVQCEATRDASRLSPSMAGAAGGAVSTVGDLRMWAQALASGALVSEKSAKAQWATVPLGGAAPQWQGYGLGATQVGPLRGGTGVMPGSLSAAYTDPASGLTVAVMLNNSTAGAGFVQSVALELASIAAGAAAVEGESAPRIELPWSAEQMVAALTAGAVCQPPAEPAEAAPAG